MYIIVFGFNGVKQNLLRIWNIQNRIDDVENSFSLFALNISSLILNEVWSCDLVVQSSYSIFSNLFLPLFWKLIEKKVVHYNATSRSFAPTELFLPPLQLSSKPQRSNEILYPYLELKIITIEYIILRREYQKRKLADRVAQWLFRESTNLKVPGSNLEAEERLSGSRFESTIHSVEQEIYRFVS